MVLKYLSLKVKNVRSDFFPKTSDFLQKLKEKNDFSLKNVKKSQMENLQMDEKEVKISHNNSLSFYVFKYLKIEEMYLVLLHYWITSFTELRYEGTKNTLMLFSGIVKTRFY